jgi:hypothetical protein
MRVFIRYLLLSCSVLVCSDLNGQSHTRDMQKEAAIWDQLRVVNPDLLEIFKQGTERMDAGDYKNAAVLYKKVVDGAPAFDVGYRRLGTSLCLDRDVSQGLPLLEKAVSMNRSSENLSTLAQFIAFPGPGVTGTREAQQRAITLLQEARHTNSKPDAADLYLTAQIAAELQNENEFKEAAHQMMMHFPDHPESHYLNAMIAAGDQRWSDAESEARRAAQLGMPQELVQRFLDESGVQWHANEVRYAFYAAGVVLAWIAGLALLFVFGKALSQMTLHSIERSAGSKATVSSKELTLRKIYRQLIQVAGWYYYLSLPFVVLLLIAAAGAVVYGFLAIGRIPIRLVLIIGIVTLGTIYKLVQSLFVKIKTEDPGRPLTVDEAPGLWSLTREVAAEIGTRPVDEIRMTIGTDVAVYEKGTRKEKTQDKAKRILILGVGVLNGFRMHAFRAVLAHEYGHFTHRDTAGGEDALRVNNDMMKFAYAMAMAGHAVWWNLGFQFVRIYHFLFRRISHGASRLQEILADRMAALKYGAEAFEEGLTHAIRRSVEFPFAANREITVAINGGRAVQNLYGLALEKESPVEDEIEKALNRPTSEDDTHPSPVERFRLIRQLGGPSTAQDNGLVWDLFQNRDALTMEMTVLIDQSIDRSGTPVSDSAVPTFKEVDL